MVSDQLAVRPVLHFVVGPGRAVAQHAHLGYSTFEAWRALVPEIAGARVCGLTIAGHELWAAGQLSMPLHRFLHGDFRTSGSLDWAVELSAHGDDRPCRYLLVVTQGAGVWRRLLLEPVKLEDGAAGFTVVWSPELRALGVDLGHRKRLTAPATLTFENGSVVRAQAGYVIERLLIGTGATGIRACRSLFARVLPFPRNGTALNSVRVGHRGPLGLTRLRVAG